MELKKCFFVELKKCFKNEFFFPKFSLLEKKRKIKLLKSKLNANVFDSKLILFKFFSLKQITKNSINVIFFSMKS